MGHERSRAPRGRTTPNPCPKGWALDDDGGAEVWRCETCGEAVLVEVHGPDAARELAALHVESSRVHYFHGLVNEGAMGGHGVSLIEAAACGLLSLGELALLIGAEVPRAELRALMTADALEEWSLRAFDTLHPEAGRLCAELARAVEVSAVHKVSFWLSLRRVRRVTVPR